MRWIWALSALLILLSGCGREESRPVAEKVEPPTPGQVMAPADLVLKNGYIYTADRSERIAQAIAVRDGRIIHVGSDGDAAAFIGPHTRVENLEGRLVLPGSVEVRRPVRGVDLYGGKSVGDYQDAVAEFIRANPEHQVIVGEGWDNRAFSGRPPHKDQLDQVNDFIPIVLFSSDHRSIWANSEALAAAGIDSDTPNPEGGVIEKDDNGLAVGVLRGESAMALVEKIIPQKAKEGRAETRTVQDIVSRIRRGKETGSLETGKWADFIVLDKNLFQIPEEEVHTVKVLRTYYKGRLIFDAENAEFL